ncbi:PAS domain-containing protein [Oricola indica]|jgi:hypothetical protein|uniref:PAS domain-containing protein n=1 Tax=Oricola indica TaxID=2872591 RepID=UPI001CBE8447|nr:PAS domain-containing protein [Oricola indica]
MDLSSLIDDYRHCETALSRAIQVEDSAAIRELDIRMRWFRNSIRDASSKCMFERRMQIDFFMDLVSKTTDHSADKPPLSDLHAVIDRYVADGAKSRGNDRNATPALDAELGRRIFEDGLPDREAMSMIELTNLRISTVGTDWRIGYTSPANGRFHGKPPDAIHDRHIVELIGDRRFEKRARAYLERCFGGEDLSYCYYLDTEDHGRLLLECQMLTQRRSDDAVGGAIIVMRDLTEDFRDPIRSAEENRV